MAQEQVKAVAEVCDTDLTYDKAFWFVTNQDEALIQQVRQCCGLIVTALSYELTVFELGKEATYGAGEAGIGSSSHHAVLPRRLSVHHAWASQALRTLVSAL